MASQPERLPAPAQAQSTPKQDVAADGSVPAPRDRVDGFNYDLLGMDCDLGAGELGLAPPFVFDRLDLLSQLPPPFAFASTGPSAPTEAAPANAAPTNAAPTNAAPTNPSSPPAHPSPTTACSPTTTLSSDPHSHASDLSSLIAAPPSPLSPLNLSILSSPSSSPTSSSSPEFAVSDDSAAAHDQFAADGHSIDQLFAGLSRLSSPLEPATAAASFAGPAAVPYAAQPTAPTPGSLTAAVGPLAASSELYPNYASSEAWSLGPSPMLSHAPAPAGRAAAKPDSGMPSINPQADTNAADPTATLDLSPEYYMQLLAPLAVEPVASASASAMTGHDSQLTTAFDTGILGGFCCRSHNGPCSAACLAVAGGPRAAAPAAPATSVPMAPPATPLAMRPKASDQSTRPRRYPCRPCGKAFVSRKDLGRHCAALVHRETERRLAALSGVMSVEPLAAPRNDFICACGFRQARRDLYKRHLRSCSGTRPYRLLPRAVRAGDTSLPTASSLLGPYRCACGAHSTYDRLVHVGHVGSCGLRRKGRQPARYQ